MKKITFIAFGLAMMTATHAQQEPQTTLSADIVNQYIWRGQDLGHAALQPTLGIRYHRLSLSAWGSLGIADTQDTKELDLTASYSVGGLTVSMTDYWFNTPEERYFLYDAHRTSHVLEAGVGYDFGLFSVQWYTNFAGNDGINKSGHRAYSSYVEGCFPFRLYGLDCTATAGVVPFATTSYAASGLAVTNVSLQAAKPVSISAHFSLPLSAGIVVNPCTQKAYLVFGVTLQP